MRNFSISELEKFSGIKAHTLRTWEQRHGIPRPQRDGQVRKYTLEELKQVMVLALLNKNGHRISTLARLSSDDLEQKLRLLHDDESKHQMVINQMLINMYELRIEEFENVLNFSLHTWSLRQVMNEIVYPFLKLSSLLWKGNKLTEEHLVVTVLRKKIIYAIEEAARKPRTGKKILLFLTNTRQLDLALLFAAYRLTDAGAQVIYMGYDVSLENLQDVFHRVKPDYLYTYLPDKNSFPFRELTEVFDKEAPGCKLVITTYPECYSRQPISEKVLLMSFDGALEFLSNA